MESAKLIQMLDKVICVLIPVTAIWKAIYQSLFFSAGYCVIFI